jgi:hypothetical protein
MGVIDSLFHRALLYVRRLPGNLGEPSKIETHGPCPIRLRIGLQSRWGLKLHLANKPDNLKHGFAGNEGCIAAYCDHTVVDCHGRGAEAHDGRHTRSESLFYYFRLEDQVPENHLLRLIDAHIDFSFVREQLKGSYSDMRSNSDSWKRSTHLRLILRQIFEIVR